jgi:hypothetical protein
VLFHFLICWDLVVISNQRKIVGTTDVQIAVVEPAISRFNIVNCERTPSLLVYIIIWLHG